MTPNKPREFWIAYFETGRVQVSTSKIDESYSYYSGAAGILYAQDIIHVIEFSAYEVIKQKLVEAEMQNRTIDRVWDHLFRQLKEELAAAKAELAKAKNLKSAIKQKASAHDDGAMAYSVLESENKRLREALDLLRRYHGGDGTITREAVIAVLKK